MMHKLSFVVILLSFGRAAYAQVVTRGQCPNVQYLNDFDLAAYTGLWYEYAKYPVIFEAGQRCVTAQYSDIGNNRVGVVNSALFKNTNLPVNIEGSAAVLGPGRLAVSFGPSTLANLIPSIENYDVLGTDYESWALVYSCQQVGPYRLEFNWILTRMRVPTRAQINAARRVMAANGISQNYLTITDQNNC